LPCICPYSRLLEPLEAREYGMSIYQSRKIGTILTEQGSLSHEQRALVLEQLPASCGRRFGEICLGENYITEEELAAALAEQFGLEFEDFTDFKLDDELLSSLPSDVMHRFKFVPLAGDQTSLTIAVADPTDVIRLDELELLLDRQVQIKVASETALHDILKRGGTARNMLREVSEDFMLQLVRETDSGEEVLSAESVSADVSPIIKLINTILMDALHRRASDIHIETAPNGVVIKYRIDGVLFQANDLISPHFQAPIISRLKVMSELDIAERRIPQDGRFKIRMGGKAIDFRVSIMPSTLGEDAVLRILDKESIANDLHGLSFETLGMHPREMRRLRKKIREPYGMVLVTGPTGSGKTTTLYAALTEIHTGEEKIITIEDPVEYMLPGILQIPVNEKKGLTFAKGLRSILRHDPDKIMVGEIRDSDTAKIAVQSALTGHLVFTTVHANNAFDVIGRFIHMGIDPYNFVASLNCVVAQRLVRKICRECRSPIIHSDELLRENNIDPERCRDLVLYESRGCETCNGTGFNGRSAIVEMLEMNDQIRDLIISRVPAAELKDVAQTLGTVFLRESAVEKLLAGETTLREINRVTFVE
jgi:type IV pilus assembly protein PilB